MADMPDCTVEWDGDENCYIARCPAFPGLYSKSMHPDRAREAVETAVRSRLRKPKPKPKELNVRLRSWVWRAPGDRDV